MGGVSAEDFKLMKEEQSEDKITHFFDGLMFRTYNIMIKRKNDYFNGENRMRFFAVKVLPHNVQ